MICFCRWPHLNYQIVKHFLVGPGVQQSVNQNLRRPYWGIGRLHDSARHSGPEPKASSGNAISFNQWSGGWSASTTTFQLHHSTEAAVLNMMLSSWSRTRLGVHKGKVCLLLRFISYPTVVSYFRNRLALCHICVICHFKSLCFVVHVGFSYADKLKRCNDLMDNKQELITKFVNFFCYCLSGICKDIIWCRGLTYLVNTLI